MWIGLYIWITDCFTACLPRGSLALVLQTVKYDATTQHSGSQAAIPTASPIKTSRNGVDRGFCDKRYKSTKVGCYQRKPSEIMYTGKLDPKQWAKGARGTSVARGYRWYPASLVLFLPVIPSLAGWRSGPSSLILWCCFRCSVLLRWSSADADSRRSFSVVASSK
eukprot:gb/GECG01002845.1/.p1 GENE.gb/GECG01002845.1/~~gb/GECG01002845.1/.p1  ORF type:complete len:165 (+),score=8.01 gb/GECG01002845.1/:1-495(+)